MLTDRLSDNIEDLKSSEKKSLSQNVQPLPDAGYDREMHHFVSQFSSIWELKTSPLKTDVEKNNPVLSRMKKPIA